uniref:Orf c06014 protein n=1 Tax=Saccharolobus solfataricus TaxID=2287 RepID=P95861_SACSO|nr:orf c06014 [Saccharolobus solfataricus P2]
MESNCGISPCAGDQNTFSKRKISSAILTHLDICSDAFSITIFSSLLLSLFISSITSFLSTTIYFPDLNASSLRLFKLTFLPFKKYLPPISSTKSISLAINPPLIMRKSTLFDFAIFSDLLNEYSEP